MLSRAVYGPLDRVRRVSRVMLVMIVIVAAIFLLLLSWAWLGPWVIEKYVLAKNLEVKPHLSFPVEDAAVKNHAQLILIMASLYVVLVLYALYQAYQLFAGYRRGEVLTVRAAGRIRHISYAMLALAVGVPGTQTALSVVLTWNASSGPRLALPLGDHYLTALAGGLLLAIAHVLTEAAKIARESSEIV